MMQIKSYKKRAVLFFMILSLLTVPTMVYANSAEPPGLVLLIPGYTDSVTGQVVYENGETVYGDSSYWPTEAQIHFRYYNGYKPDGIVGLQLEWREGSVFIELDEKLDKYHETYRVNLKEGTVAEGKGLARSAVLVGLRVLLTLLIEGLIFFVIGYRKKRSWRFFLIINLVTQLSLNIYLNSLEVATAYGGVLGLIFAEFWILVVELILFTMLLDEHRKRRAVFYAVIANFLSLMLGGYLISVLPI